MKKQTYLERVNSQVAKSSLNLISKNNHSRKGASSSQGTIDLEFLVKGSLKGLLRDYELVHCLSQSNGPRRRI